MELRGLESEPLLATAWSADRRSVRAGSNAVRKARSLCEAIRRLDEEFVGDVGSAVVFVFDYMQGGKRELLREAPDHAERRCDAEPTSDEHRRNIGDAVGAPADAIRRQNACWPKT